MLDVPKTAAALLAASTNRLNRSVPITVATQAPKRTTADAQAMGITGIVSSYTTLYGGVPNRIHNVEVVSHLVDNTLIAPGKEFSFNGTTGERNAAKGLLEAPVIINGELENGLGGGTCQVSTTVFNAAYEAGLPITARTNHALYISHYPQGRDATVNYPDIDLKFVNDTDHWLLLRTFVSSSSLTVNLYGTPQHRRVESETAPLVTTGPVPDGGHQGPDPPRRPEGRRRGRLAAAVDERDRKVYDENGKLLYDNTWYSSYVGEKAIVRVGTKPKPKPKPKQPPITPSAYLSTEPRPDRAAHRPSRRPTRRRPSRRRRPARPPASRAAAIASASQAGKPRRPERLAVDHGVLRPAVGDDLAVALEHVLEAEPRAADVDAAGVDPDPVVEEHRLQVADVRLGRQRLVPVGLDAPVAAAEPGEVVDARDLVPDEVGGVVGDALRVGLREADGDLGREAEALHAASYYRARGSSSVSPS